MKIACAVLVLTLTFGCSCNSVPRLSRVDLENATFECYSGGECERIMRWSDLPSRSQDQLLKWASNAPTSARFSLSTYAPSVIIRSPRMNVNFTMGLVVSNYEASPGTWKQLVRDMNELDKLVRDNIVKVNIVKPRQAGDL